MPDLLAGVRRHPDAKDPEYHRERFRLTKAEPDPARRQHMRDMAVFDLNTDADALDRHDPQVADAIRALRIYLPYRTLLRAAHAIAGLPFAIPKEDQEYLAAGAHVESHMRRVLELLYGRGAHFRSKRFEATFGAFATGELTITDATSATDLDSAGIPDTAQFFSFAEAALFFAALDLNKHRTFWLQRLPIFVTTAEYFVGAYWDGSNRLPLAYARAHHRRTPMNWRSAQHRMQCRHPGDLARAFSTAVAFALRDDAERTHPAPAVRKPHSRIGMPEAQALCPEAPARPTTNTRKTRKARKTARTTP